MKSIPRIYVRLHEVISPYGRGYVSAGFVQNESMMRFLSKSVTKIDST